MISNNPSRLANFAIVVLSAFLFAVLAPATTRSQTTGTYPAGTVPSYPGAMYGVPVSPSGTVPSYPGTMPVPTTTIPSNWIEDTYQIRFLPKTDLAGLSQQLAAALQLKAGQVAVFYNSLLLRGTKEEIDKIKKFAAAVDQKPRHIIFEAMLIAVDTSRVKNLGAEIVKNYEDTDADRSHVLTSTIDNRVAGNSNFLNTIIWTYTQGINSLEMTVGYLLENGAAEVVSKPVVRVQDGGSGIFKKGANVPQKTVSQSGTRVEYKSTGISIKITDAQIISSVNPELESGDPGFAMDMVWAKVEVTDGTIGEVTTEGITTNDTVVQNSGYYVSGDTYIVASLVKESANYRKQSVPGLGNVPLLGKLFSKKTTDVKHTETIILMRPTIETDMTHQFLASHYDETSRRHLPIHLGGRSRDSINVHPLADTMWESVPSIYNPPKPGNVLCFWNLAAKYSPEEIEFAGVLFKKVRNRVGLILGQDLYQLEMQIRADQGISQTLASIQEEFRQKYQKEPPASLEFLVAAAHHGYVNQWAFDLYLDIIRQIENPRGGTSSTGGAGILDAASVSAFSGGALGADAAPPRIFTGAAPGTVAQAKNSQLLP